MIARTWHDIVVVRVEGEIAGARVVLVLAVLIRRQDEKSVARERKVGILARRLRRSIAEEQVDARDADAETDLLGVRAADGCRRGGRACRCLVERVGERHAARLEADRVDIRDVVADDVHARLVALEP